MVYKASFLWRGFNASVRRFATPVTNHTSIGRSVMSKDIGSNKSLVTHTDKRAQLGVSSEAQGVAGNFAMR